MKRILVTFLFTFIAVFTFGQVKLGIGIKAGANFANTNISSINSDAITSFHAGAYALIKAGNIGVQPEVLISRQGSEFSLRGESAELDLSYLNIPVMLKFYLPLGLNVQAGPQFGILKKAEDKVGSDIKNKLKSSDLSVGFGAGWDASFGLQLSARYLLGLSDINDTLGFTNEIKSKIFQVSIGYQLFKLGN